MNIHEYQAKQILSKFNVPIPKGFVADSAEAAQSSANELGGDLWVVKAQIHSGARGKAGGIIVCKNEQDVSDATNKLLGKTLVTHQTGPEGKTVHKVYIEEGTDIKKEFYLGLVFDRSSESIMVITSSEGGMSIEEIAEEKPESIVKTKVEAAVGLQAFQAREIAFGLGLEGKAINRCAQAILGTYQAFCSSEATMAEINPLVLTGDNQILALDCKMTIDDNALFRNSNLLELKDKTQEDPKETYAAEQGLNYIPLDGAIGNIINGAGLAMASMDMIQLAGGQPANFLDVGGGATPEKFVKAFKLISGDTNVKVILINIFAGINRCDWVAQGIVDALAQINIEQPLVIRLAGTNVDEGIKILKDSKIEYIEASTLEDAANKAVKAQKDLENK
ncbi:MAG: ADP-forming succinate--CoA ligase subunit beta [Gammaproteobacteria bacterium]|nr:ADP-forming succinate--CoA ligase subunit beta [Gammaproteobacteria bacterium]MBL6818836.1 ADP-forming succinate--CoA ligase subunit beta [Gammaproteobacteria bacterium]MBL6898610.1 ADP-forming succinate--CoA ligase subunit beta [Gammaproteobacteria bacterium]